MADVLVEAAAAVVLAAAVFCSARRLMRGTPTTRTVRWDTFLMGVGAAGLAMLDLTAIRSGFPTEDIISLEFPLQGRTFVVLQGGRSALTNPFHSGNPAGRLSLDIVAVGRFGSRARRLLPLRLPDYFVFGLPVKCPCTGDVAAAVDGLTDNPPGRPDSQHPPGNHVLLRCDRNDAVLVLLAHLQAGSVRKHAGDRVLRGELVGAVGNSGNTSEPHLHMQATRGDLTQGTPVSILLDGRFLTTNNLVFDVYDSSPRNFSQPRGKVRRQSPNAAATRRRCWMMPAHFATSATGTRVANYSRVLSEDS